MQNDVYSTEEDCGMLRQKYRSIKGSESFEK